MKISIEKFYQNYQQFYFKKIEIGLEYKSMYEQEILCGIISNIGNKPFPLYSEDKDKWYSFEEEDGDDWGDFELTVQIRQNGKVDFCLLGDADDLSYFYFYSPNELNDFLTILPRANSEILNSNLRFKQFNFSDVILDIYISISYENSIRFMPLADIKIKLDKETFERLINSIYCHDWDFLVEIGSWQQFCEDKKLNSNSENLISLSNIPILYNQKTYSNCSPDIDNAFPYFGFSIKEDFSCQYFLDFINDTINGKQFLIDFKETILSNNNLKLLSISAPNSFIRQIKYSCEFRAQYEYYKYDITLIENHNYLDVIDLKHIYKNRRENIKEFIFNSENVKFLNLIKNPLPFNIEKNYRAYVRATKDFDRFNFIGKVYNLILKSAVFYPLEELIFMGADKKYPEIAEIIDKIKAGKISDGTWLYLFNKIAVFLAKNNEVKLIYFSKLIKGFQNNYNKINDLINKRNALAHYREHPEIFMKSLDIFLPEILDILRINLNGNLFCLIESQNYKKDGLYITAKKIMGYETDIETFEFKTSLDGKYFVKDSFIVYNSEYGYTVPLENFFKVEIVQSEAIRMGVIGNINNGVADYEY